ncbi:MAG: cellulase family glycosylhydrolase [Bacteroidales bacterium]|nr:cellulase family glycosylhydrolase [Bacteroidales bacterium]
MAFATNASAEALHVKSLPWQGSHSFNSNEWANKVMIYPEAFGLLDNTAYKYSLHIEADCNVQLGFGDWTSGNEVFHGYGENSGTFDVEITASFIANLNKGWRFQLNQGSGNLSLIRLDRKERDPNEKEPDLTKGFHTDGTRLLDGNGNEFVMRGLNYSYAWQTGSWGVIKSAKDWGCNAIRINIGDGKASERDGNGWLSYTDRSTLESLILECEKDKLIGVFSPHNETGSNSTGDLMNAADYWAGMADVMNAHLGTAILNITNEWMSDEDAAKWSDSYVQAVTRIREAGIKSTIIVDVAGYGQGASVLSADDGRHAQAIIDADPLHNIMFSIHMYHVSGQTAEIARGFMDDALALDVPLLIGEIAYEHKAHLAWPEGGPVAWESILEYAREKNVSWLAWSWTGNGGNAETCDMFDGSGNILENGRCMIFNENGIKATSTECTIYDGNAGTGLDYQYPEGPFDFAFYPDKGGDNPGGDDFDDTFFSHMMPYSVASWNNMFQIKAPFFANARDGYTVRITLSDCKSGAEIQVAYNHLDKGDDKYTKIIDYESINDNVYEMTIGKSQSNAPALRARPLDGNDMLRHLQADGLYLKGHDYSISSVELLDNNGNPTTGIDDIEPDSLEPVEIYTVTGIRVAEMTPGNVYIVRQGHRVTKVVR